MKAVGQLLHAPRTLDEPASVRQTASREGSSKAPPPGRGGGPRDRAVVEEESVRLSLQPALLGAAAPPLHHARATRRDPGAEAEGASARGRSRYRLLLARGGR